MTFYPGQEAHNKREAIDYLTDYTVNKDGCWVYNGSVKEDNNGNIRVRFDGAKKKVIIERVAWEFEHGPVPEGFVVMRCKAVTSGHCINPAHLHLGTRSDVSTRTTIMGRNPWQRDMFGNVATRPRTAPKLGKKACRRFNSRVLAVQLDLFEKRRNTYYVETDREQTSRRYAAKP